VFGKIATDVCGADMKRSRTTAFGMSFDDHTHLLFNGDEVSLGSQVGGVRQVPGIIRCANSPIETLGQNDRFRKIVRPFSYRVKIPPG
jgi:hypothetical protein